MANGHLNGANMWKGLFSVYAAAVGIVLGLVLWTVLDNSAKLDTYHERLVAIENSRFTARDGLEVWRELGSVRQDMAKLPPESWQQRIRNLEEYVARHSGGK